MLGGWPQPHRQSGAPDLILAGAPAANPIPAGLMAHRSPGDAGIGVSQTALPITVTSGGTKLVEPTTASGFGNLSPGDAGDATGSAQKNPNTPWRTI